MLNNKEQLKEELRHLLNKLSVDNSLNTPDYILADFLVDFLENIEQVINKREKWFGR